MPIGAGVYGSGLFGGSAVTGTPAVVQPGLNIGLGDIPIRIVADYLRANLNAYGSTLWGQLGGPGQPCNVAYLNDPREFAFIESYLPSIFVYRSAGVDGATEEWFAQDLLEAMSRWTVMFVYPPAQQALQNKRDTFDNVVIKIIGRAIEVYRDPSYVAPGDTDVHAATTPFAAEAIRTGIATSTVQQTYSGAALNGGIGTGVINPPRPVTVTLGGSPASFFDGSRVTIFGLDVVGRPLTSVLTIHTSGVPGTLTSANDFTLVASVTVDAQAGASGLISVGTGARAGLGSLYLEAAGVEGLELANWKNTELKIPMAAGAPPRSYFALELTLAATELQGGYVSPEEAPNVGTTVGFTRADGSDIESATY